VVRTTCSIGFACYPFVRSEPDLLGWEQVITLADHALYQAKERRNGWVGFAGAQGLSSGEDLLLALRNRPDDLVERGVLDRRSGGPVAAAAC
jgi:GGDEF domain-containing protein